MASDRILERKTFPENTFVFKQGQDGDRAYVIQSGEIEIIKIGEGGEETILGTIGKGAFFGEMALLDNTPRMASARTSIPTTLIIIGRQDFEHKMAKADPFLRGLIQVLAGTIRELASTKAK